jgi:spore maturation protein SpmA
VNIIFFAIVSIAFTVASYRQFNWDGEAADSPMSSVGSAMMDAATGSVELALGLVGVMALFLGLMKIAEKGGLLVVIARLVRPLMIRLFPEVPANHPAMGAMIMNMSANAMGLGNAATPFGIRAMEQLNTLNNSKGVATNSMALFLAINTSSVTLLPTGVIAIRASVGSADAAGIVPTTLFATILSTAIAIIVAKLCMCYWSPAETVRVGGLEDASADANSYPSNIVAKSDNQSSDQRGVIENGGANDVQAYRPWVTYLALGCLAAMIPVTVLYGSSVSPWIIPGLMMALLTFGVCKRVNIYESFVEGAKEGFNVALRIIPYLVAILVAVGMFRSSGAMDLIVVPLGRITELFGMPAQALPMALLRPLSGSGAYGIMTSIISDPSIGPDSYTGYLVSTIQGSTETTFYVLAVYFGAVGIKKIRFALIPALLADVAGVTGAVIACSYLYG